MRTSSILVLLDNIGTYLKPTICQVDIAYILRYIYPGDYSEGVTCRHCFNHAKGMPSMQWSALTHMFDKKYPKDRHSIAVNGIKEPITVHIDKHKVVEDGHHRIFAARDLNIKWVPCAVYGKLTIPGKFVC